MTTLTKCQRRGLEIALSHLYSDNVKSAKRVLNNLLRSPLFSPIGSSALKDAQRDELLERFNSSARLQDINLWSRG